MKKVSKIIVTIFLLISYGCEIPNEYLNTKLEYSLVSNLIVNEDKQEIFIYRLVDDELDFELNSSNKYFEKDANILLYNNEMSFNSFEIKIDSNSYFNRYSSYSNSSELFLKPNTNYNFKIKINEKILTGRTKTPSDFSIILPSNNTIINLDNLNNDNCIIIKWRKSLTAKGYIANIIQHYFRETQDTIIEATKRKQFLVQDTTFKFSDYKTAVGNIEISILAYDENYHNHFIEKIKPTGVEGCYGYAASSIKKSVNIIIVE